MLDDVSRRARLALDPVGIDRVDVDEALLLGEPAGLEVRVLEGAVDLADLGAGRAEDLRDRLAAETRIGALDVALVVTLLAYAIVSGLPLGDTLPFALVLLVASVPAALPATFTLAQALGAQEPAHRGVLVTRLSAIEEAAAMDVLEIRQIPVLQDNYVYLIREPRQGAVAVVDPSVAPPVAAMLRELGWTLTHILNTHHHWDHTGGNFALKAATGCVVVGPRADAERIPGLDIEVGEGDFLPFGETQAQVFDVPGHTRGHIAYWFADAHALFCGDTLFSLGCGRLFEGTPRQMWESLSKLRRLPDETRIYCGHEYTQANARFALTVEADNARLVARSAEIDRLRAAGKRTVPSTMGEERATNPFLRADQPSVARAVGLPPSDPVAVFAAVRARKDKF